MTASQPLAGKRILVTRARQQAGRLAESLEALGAEVIRLPTIEIIPPESYAHFDAALEVISGFDWLVVSSANAVAALADRMQFLGISAHQFKHLQIAAVGPATANALGRLGLKVAAMPEEYVAEAVVAMLRDKVDGKHVLLARARVARDVIPQELRKCGADIHVVEAYRTVIPADSIDQVRTLFAEGNAFPDAVTFTSSSTVSNFFALLDAAKVELPPGLRAVSIGPITTRTLQLHGWPPACQAEQYDLAGLTSACVKVLALE
jgi:uroporphyrinogen-III synthase